MVRSLFYYSLGRRIMKLRQEKVGSEAGFLIF